MEKVLIIATHWPPNGVTGTYRTIGFVDNLRQFGYEPILVTINWSEDQLKEDYIIEDYNGIEIYKVNHKEGISRLINKKFATKYSYIRKAYNMIDKILWTNGIWTFNEHNGIFETAKIIIEKHPDIKKAIIITGPYPLYYIGYYLNKKYGINWIADYRDAWNTMEFVESNIPESRLGAFLKPWLEEKAEKKWVGTAKYVTSVSEHYSKRISAFVGVPFKTIYNGFFESELKLYHPKPTNEKIKILYNGTLYINQNIEIFINGFKTFIDNNDNISIEIKFAGTGNLPTSCERIKDLLKGYEKYYEITDRVSKQTIIDEINNSDILLLVSHGKKFKGVATSKIFDYFASRKPVICCPSDGDVVEELLTASGQGFFANSDTEVEELLGVLVKQIQKDGKVNFNFNFKEIMKYSRENQTKEMAALLDKL